MTRAGMRRTRHGLAAVVLFGHLGMVWAAEPLLRVVTLSTVLTEIAREVGGEQVSVTGLLQPGVDPHSFEPSPADMRAVVAADVVFASGLNLESYLDRLVANSRPGVILVSVGDALPQSLGPTAPTDRSGSGSGAIREPDPHWWHSIGNVRMAVELVRDRYKSMRPASAEAFDRNARAYLGRLSALQAWVAEQIARLPPARRQLVTSHDAFGYFARDYGFAIHAIGGPSTDGEPNARHLAALIDLIRREHIPAVFADGSANPQLVANLVRETGVRLGGTLYADGLGLGDAGTYEGMYRHNVTTIVEALR
jgi:zinc/manganese transport system substrate-binding protein